MLSRKVAIRLSNKIISSTGGVVDLDIASQVVVSIVCGELVCSQLSHVCKIQLVIANGQKIHGNGFENGIADFAVRQCRVTKPIAIVQVSGINYQQVDSIFCCLVPHIFHK